MTTLSAADLIEPRAQAATAATATRPLDGPSGHEAVADTLRRAGGGRSACVLVLGSGGSGKSTLARWMADHAGQQGFECIEVGGHAVGEVPGLIAQSVAASLEPGGHWAEDARAIVDTLAAVDAAAGRAPVALILDDLDRYSAPDLAFVEQLLLRPPRGRFVLALTANAERAERHNPRAADLITTFAGAPNRAVVRLRPLSAAESELVTLEQLGRRSVSAYFASELHALTGGNRGRLSAVLTFLQGLDDEEREAIVNGGRSLAAVRLPMLVEREALEELAGLADAQREVLEALATWASMASVRQLARLVDRDAAGTERSLRELDDRRLSGARVHGGAVSYELEPALRQHVYSLMATGRRLRFHRRAAEIVEDQLAAGGAANEAGFARLAEHYVRGGLPASGERAERLVHAGREFLRAGRYGDAAEVLRYARRGVPAGDARYGEIIAGLSEAHLRLGDPARAEAVLVAELHELPNDTRARLIHRLVRIRSAAGDAKAAAALVDRALAMGTLTPTVEVDLLGEMASLEHDLGRPVEALEHAQRGAVLAEGRVGAARASALVLKMVDIHLTAGHNREALVEGRRAVSLAQEAGSDRDLGRALVGVGMGLRQIGEAERAICWMERARAVALKAHDRSGEAFIDFEVACTLMELGRWDAAFEAALMAIEQDQALHRDRALHRSSAIAAELAALRVAKSQIHPFKETLRGQAGVQPQSPRDYVAMGIAQAITDLLEDNVEPAAVRLRDLERRLDGTPGWEYALYAEVLAWAGRVASERRDAVELARLATRYAMAPMNPSEAPLVAGEGSLALARHLSEQGDATAAIELAAAAAATFEASGYAYRAALAAMEGALALARGPAPEAAAGRLKEAFRQLAAIGAMREVERVRETLHLLNLRAPAPTRLRSDGAPTPREAEVAELASEGLTDRQIATRLDISERTVGTHMHRLLKKLGLKSRHELRHLSSTVGDIGATPHLA